MKRYAIWDKQSPVIVPTGKVYSARQWMDKYPAAALDSITVVCAAGEINGGFFGTLGQMVQLYEAQGGGFFRLHRPGGEAGGHRGLRGCPQRRRGHRQPGGTHRRRPGIPGADLSGGCGTARRPGGDRIKEAAA